MAFNAGLQWQTVYYGIFEYKNNCLKSIKGPFSCLFKTQKMKAYPSHAETITKYRILNDKTVQNSAKRCENRILGFLLSC